jgi:GntR family transcriptional repressor for pyruvate dehydrogenase complex
MFNQVHSEKIYQQVNRQIQELILSGELKKGDKLPGERQLAELLGVSRASVRESLRSLEIMGFLESRSGEGTFISESNAPILLEPLSIMFKLNNGTFRDILEIRLVLEVEAAGLAAIRLTERDELKLRKLLRQLEECDDEGRSVEIDKAIHLAIAQSTGNYLIVTMLDAISSLMTSFIADARKIIVKNIKEQGCLEKIHHDVIAAICSHDPKQAQNAMRSHFDSVMESARMENMI